MDQPGRSRQISALDTVVYAGRRPVEMRMQRISAVCNYIEGLDLGTAESRWRSDRRVSGARAERFRCHGIAVSAADNTRSSSPTLFNYTQLHTYIQAI